MKVKKAEQRSTRFLVSGTVLLIVGISLSLAGIDLLSTPIRITAVCLVMISVYWSGWVKGHRDAG